MAHSLALKRRDAQSDLCHLSVRTRQSRDQGLGERGGLADICFPRASQCTACHCTFAWLWPRSMDVHLPKALWLGRWCAGSTWEKLPQHTPIPLCQELAPLERSSDRHRFLPLTERPA